MKIKLFFFFLLSGVSLRSSFGQTTSAILKDKIIGKWIYEGTEEFGVVTVDSIMKNDRIELLADGNYNGVFMSKSESGNYKVTESTKQIFLTNIVTKKTRMYKIKSVSASELTIDYQTPDLVHSLYQFKRTE